MEKILQGRHSQKINAETGLCFLSNTHWQGQHLSTIEIRFLKSKVSDLFKKIIFIYLFIHLFIYERLEGGESGGRGRDRESQADSEHTQGLIS